MGITKKCPYCGGEILAVAKKCKHCSQWLNQDKVCPVCREAIPFDAKICPVCGEHTDETGTQKQEDSVASTPSHVQPNVEQSMVTQSVDQIRHEQSRSQEYAQSISKQLSHEKILLQKSENKMTLADKINKKLEPLNKYEGVFQTVKIILSCIFLFVVFYFKWGGKEWLERLSHKTSYIEDCDEGNGDSSNMSSMDFVSYVLDNGKTDCEHQIEGFPIDFMKSDGNVAYVTIGDEIFDYEGYDSIQTYAIDLNHDGYKDYYVKDSMDGHSFFIYHPSEKSFYKVDDDLGSCSVDIATTKDKTYVRFYLSHTNFYGELLVSDELITCEERTWQEYWDIDSQKFLTGYNLMVGDGVECDEPNQPLKDIVTQFKNLNQLK